ncbi:R3H domain containing-like isoform X2 [Ictalurus punctatus]|uniref:R3H domain containing-like isoform X2 n=1 Tax=Ictalurus punctatus TaxID=7998 RepID=A0A979F807_ICTPU|nr:R3H domain containing-like isoform X2 [Ictalurus punctatus]
MRVCCSHLVLAAILWAMPCTRAAVALTNPTELSPLIVADFGIELSWRNSSSSGDASHSRRKRYISSRDMMALLDYHNRVRSQVFPPAANMEYMVWDERLAKSAEFWAAQCIWDHGPPHVMRYRSVTELVKSWHDEKYSFSYPNRCTGSVCTHYTQMVWASTNRIGCAINRCSKMYVFGAKWKQATLLVCNYSIKGNWVGEAPYKTGKPCSACPSIYGGSCNRNQCSTSKPRTKLKRF